MKMDGYVSKELGLEILGGKKKISKKDLKLNQFGMFMED